MRGWDDPRVVSKTPLLTTALLEGANGQQLWRMWSERTAAGQSLWGWLCVGAALGLWCNYYRVLCPGERFAVRCTLFGCLMNGLVCLTVIYFRYFQHR